MLAVFATLKTAQFWLKAAPYLLIAAAVIGGALWVRGMQHTIAEQRTELSSLSGKLATETAARQRDVAGLTSLSTGLLAASSAKDKDQAALQETIDVAHPTPVSAGLANLLQCLRQNDDGKLCAATARIGGTAAPAAAGAR